MEISNSMMTMMQIILVIFIAYQLVMGFTKGFLNRIFSLVAWLASLILAWYLAGALSSTIMLIPKSIMDHNIVNEVISVLLNFWVFYLLMVIILRFAFMLFKPLVDGLSKLPILKTVNQVLGVLFGMIISLVVMIALTIILMIPIFQNGQAVIDATPLKYTQPIVTLVIDHVTVGIQDYIALQKVLLKEAVETDLQKVRVILEKFKFTSEQIQAFLQMKGY